MSQFGSPSGEGAPGITVAKAKVQFEADQDSLDEMLRQVEQKYAESIDRIRVSAKAALEEVKADTLEFLDTLKERADALKIDPSQQDQQGQGAPQPQDLEEAVRILGDLRESATQLEASVSSIDENVQELLNRGQ